MEREIKKRGL